MREILFKAKRIDSKGWVFGFYMMGLNNLSYIINVVDFNEKSSQLDYTIVIPETVCQFTGLIDNNGLKIFEGDMVFVDYNYLGEVTATMFNFYVKKYALNKCSVIGNIHD